MLVSLVNDLINLDWAQKQAMHIYGRAYVRKYPMEV